MLSLSNPGSPPYRAQLAVLLSGATCTDGSTDTSRSTDVRVPATLGVGMGEIEKADVKIERTTRGIAEMSAVS